MVGITKIVPAEKFEKDVRKIRDNSVKARIYTEVEKIRENPEVGKPLKYGLKGERTVRIHPYRLIYSVVGDKLILLRFEHRGKAYD
ncbi:MAG: type II toxin-antitoxin system RelE/ParE family toxin [Candidatus Marsarchaeota archaeon]|nr:type II toxin-antitoxin system RelE/ParE family toxin [Candidatus Marsarchaeota archaeon]